MNIVISCGICLALCALLVCVVEGQQTLDFDCRRKGVTCNTGQCIMDTRQCQCSGNTTNLNYACVDVATGCTEDFYGPNCDILRVQINCAPDKMFANINPHGTFGGLIYVYGKELENDCLLTPDVDVSTLGDYVTNKNLLQGSRKEFSHKDATCGDAEEVPGTDQGSTIFMRVFVIQYNMEFTSSVDQKVKAKCVFNQQGAAASSGVEAIVNEGGNLQDVNVEGNVQAVAFELKDKDGQNLPAEITLGDEIKLVFTLAPGNGFATFKLERCIANNSVSGDDSKSIEFLKDSCPSDDGKALFVSPPSRSSQPLVAITMSITAFLFRGVSSKVAFLCDVKLCENETDADCAMPACDGFTASSESSNTPGNNETVDNSGGDNTNSTDNNNSSNDNNNNSSSNNNNGTPDSAPATDSSNGTADNATQPGAQGGPSGGSGGSRRRRKREAEAVAQVSTQINVVDPNDPKNRELPVQKEEVDCMLQSEVLALVVVLAVAVAVLLLTVIVCAHQLKTLHWKEAPPRPETRAPPVQTFSIPRLELSSSAYPPTV